MVGRSMAFKFDKDNQAFIDSNVCDASGGENKREHTLQEKDGHGVLYVRAVECCGWLEVSNLAEQQKWKFKALRLLMEEPLILPTGCWSNRYYKATRFPLFCVTTSPTMSEWLDENGWVAWPSWINPNTGNKCMPYYFPIKEIEHDVS